MYVVLIRLLWIMTGIQIMRSLKQLRVIRLVGQIHVVFTGLPALNKLVRGYKAPGFFMENIQDKAADDQDFLGHYGDTRTGVPSKAYKENFDRIFRSSAAPLV